MKDTKSLERKGTDKKEVKWDYKDKFKNIPITSEVFKKINSEASCILLHICNRCNQSCKVCYSSNKRGKFSFQELSLEEIKFILNKIGKGKKIYLTGGEPTLREDIFDIIKLIENSSSIPILYTNGIKLADSSYVKRLIEAGLKRIYFSLDSLTEKNTEYLNGKSSYLYYKLKALDNLKEQKRVKVTLSPKLIRKVNYKELPGLLDLVVKENELIKGITFVSSTVSGRYRLSLDSAVDSFEVISDLEKISKGVISESYFLEFNRLRRNLNNFFPSFLKVGIPVNRYSAYAKIDSKGNVKQFIPGKQLRRINDALENRNYFKILKYVYKYRNWLSVIKRFFQPATVEFETDAREGFTISIREITPFDQNFSTQKLEIIGIAKLLDEFYVVNYIATP